MNYGMKNNKILKMGTNSLKTQRNCVFIALIVLVHLSAMQGISFSAHCTAQVFNSFICNNVCL